MKSAKYLGVFALTAILAPALLVGGEPQDKASIWMTQKLRASQEVLKGLADGDFEAIGANAQTMNLMTHLEKWIRADTPGYRTQLRLFEFADRELIRAAKEKNLDAAALAYNQLTISCVNCHKLVRAAKH
jgi:cytochrome c556